MTHLVLATRSAPTRRVATGLARGSLRFAPSPGTGISRPSSGSGIRSSRSGPTGPRELLGEERPKRIVITRATAIKQAGGCGEVALVELDARQLGQGRRVVGELSGVSVVSGGGKRVTDGFTDSAVQVGAVGATCAIRHRGHAFEHQAQSLRGLGMTYAFLGQGVHQPRVGDELRPIRGDRIHRVEQVADLFGQGTRELRHERLSVEVRKVGDVQRVAPVEQVGAVRVGVAALKSLGKLFRGQTGHVRYSDLQCAHRVGDLKDDRGMGGGDAVQITQATDELLVVGLGGVGGRCKEVGSGSQSGGDPGGS